MDRPGPLASPRPSATPLNQQHGAGPKIHRGCLLVHGQKSCLECGRPCLGARASRPHAGAEAGGTPALPGGSRS